MCKSKVCYKQQINACCLKYTTVFRHTPRSLDDIRYCKATAISQCSFYTVRIVLGCGLEHYFYTYMHLSQAIWLNEQLNELTETLLTKFFSEASRLYTADFMVYKVRQLSHLSAEAYESGNFDVFQNFYLSTIFKF